LDSLPLDLRVQIHNKKEHTMVIFKHFRPLAGIIAALTFVSGTAIADPVERYVALDVHNPRAFVAAFDNFRKSGIMDGTTASLWAATFDGSSPTTHVIAISYDDYAEMQNVDDRVSQSREWSNYLDAIEGTSDVTAISMGVQRLVSGSDWHNHGAGMVFNMTISNAASYATEFAKLLDSMDNPGSTRLIEIRAGGEGATHLAMITAPDFATLNNYVDELFSSDTYREFAAKVGGIRRINTTSIYRRLMSWED
jgi:hypothetical protein